MLIAHLSDSHLGYRQYGLVEREKDLYSCFEEAIDRALEEHVDVIIHSGDLFHSPNPPPQAYRSALRALKKLRDRGVPFLYIMGQHDKPKTQAVAPLTVLQDMDLLIHVSERPYVSGDFSVIGVDYARKQVVKSKLQALKPLTKKSILVAHILLKEVSSLGDLSINEMPRGFFYYALGDYHIFKTLKVHGAVAAYPGSSEVISLNDLTDQGKGFCIVDISGDEARVDFQKLENVRPRIVVEAEIDRVHEVCSKILSQASSMSLKPIIHLTVKGSGIKRKDLDRIKDELSKVSLRVFVSFEEEGLSIPSARRDDQNGDIEEIIKKSLPGMGELLIGLYRAFRIGGLHSELERLLKTDEWIKWPEQVKASQPKVEVKTEAPKPSKPIETAKPKSSTLLGWLKYDNREA